jgi:hypothetical protein
LVHLEEGQIEVACDGIEALNVISEEYKAPKNGGKSYDMIGSARQYLEKSLIKWTFRHFIGHQKKPRREFNMWEQLKNDCDKEAGEFWEWCERQHRAN